MWVDNLLQNSNAVIYRQYVLNKISGVKIYKLCDDSEYTYDMGGYFGPDTQSATGNMKATHTTVRNMTQKFQSSEHKVLRTILFLVQNFK